jgi:hypothetical protein
MDYKRVIGVEPLDFADKCFIFKNGYGSNIRKPCEIQRGIIYFVSSNFTLSYHALYYCLAPTFLVCHCELRFSFGKGSFEINPVTLWKHVETTTTSE